LLGALSPGRCQGRA